MTLWRTRTARAAAAMATMALGACSSGGGPLVTTASGTRDDPGTTRDQPPSARDTPGGQCLACGITYRCTSPDSPGQSQDVQLSGSTCTPALIDVVCSGVLFSGGAPCTGGGGGAFTCGSTTCAPVQSSQPSPQPTGQGSGGGVVVDAG